MSIIDLLHANAKIEELQFEIDELKRSINMLEEELGDAEELANKFKEKCKMYAQAFSNLESDLSQID